MSLEVYIGKKFGTAHEREAFAHFLEEMYRCYENSNDLYIVIVEPEANMTSWDLIVVTQLAIILVEMKSLTAARGHKNSEIILYARESPPWEYKYGDNERRTLKVENYGNPYRQVREKSYDFRNWLMEHSINMPGGPWNEAQALRSFVSWVVVSPGFNQEKSVLDFPWQRIGSWFDLIPIDQLAHKVEVSTSGNLKLKHEHMRSFARLLGKREDNLQQFIQGYIHRDPKVSFFSRLPNEKILIDRVDEWNKLIETLADDNIKIVLLWGIGGIGKTHLATRYIQEASSMGYRVYWVNCAEREVTEESFLAAVAAETDDREQSRFILDKERNLLPDRIDSALDFIDASPSMIVFDDFHKIPSPDCLDQLLTQIVKRSSKIKVVMTSRDFPECLYNPAWSPVIRKEIPIEGLPHEVTGEFLQSVLRKQRTLTPEQLQVARARTSGNPRAIKMLGIFIDKYGWGDKVERMPLYTAAETERAWFESLLEILSPEAQKTAIKLSVFRSGFNQSALEQMVDETNLYEDIKYELEDTSFLKNAGESGFYQMPEYVREFLYDKLPENTKIASHRLAGQLFLQMSGECQSKNEEAGYLAEAVYHLAAAQDWQAVLDIAEPAFASLNLIGDWDRAQSVSAIALKASRVMESQVSICAWLIRSAEREVDQDRLDQAEQLLQESFEVLEQLSSVSNIDSKHVGLETKALLQYGRLEYYRSRLEPANDYFDRTLALAKQSGDHHLEADCLLRIGRIERQKGEYDRAMGHFTTAQKIAEDLSMPDVYVEAISHLGLIARKLGDKEEAERCFQTAYEKAKEMGDKRAMEINLSLLGDLALRSGDYQWAEMIFRECLDMSRKIRNPRGVRINLGYLAEALIHLGVFEGTDQLLDEAQLRSYQVGDMVGVAWSLKRKGLLLKAQGKIEEGDILIRQGIDELRAIGNEDYIADFERALGPIQLGLFAAGHNSQGNGQAKLPGF